MTDTPERRDTLAEHLGADPFAVVALFTDTPDLLTADAPGRSP